MKEAEQIRKSIYSVLRQKQREQQHRRPVVITNFNTYKTIITTVFTAVRETSWRRPAPQRDAVRSGVVTIPVSFCLSPKWVKAMAEFRRKPKIAAGAFEIKLLN